jgi:hypothetical protein
VGRPKTKQQQKNERVNSGGKWRAGRTCMMCPLPRSMLRWPKGDPPLLPPSVWLGCPGCSGLMWCDGPLCTGLLRSEADLLLLLSTDGARLSSMSPSSLSAEAARPLMDDSLRNCSRNDICEMGLSKTIRETRERERERQKKKGGKPRENKTNEPTNNATTTFFKMKQ